MSLRPGLFRRAAAYLRKGYETRPDLVLVWGVLVPLSTGVLAYRTLQHIWHPDNYPRYLWHPIVVRAEDVTPPNRK